MSTPTVQLTFTLRTSPNVRTVHLLGSWDKYQKQLPLSAIKDPSAKPGSWKGTFRFQGAHALQLGSRYWYYYIVDGHHVSHDPAKEYITEKTTGRKLNILDVPGGKSGSDSKQRPSVQTQNLSGSNRHSRDIPQGRGISPSKIAHPKPSKPYESRHLREADYDRSPVDDLEDRFAATRLSDRDRHGKYSSSPSDLSDDSSSSGPIFLKSPQWGSACEAAWISFLQDTTAVFELMALAPQVIKAPLGSHGAADTELLVKKKTEVVPDHERSHGYHQWQPSHLSDDYIEPTGSKNTLTPTVTNLTITPEMFEKLYLTPKTPRVGDLSKRFANPTPLGFIGFVISTLSFSMVLMGWGGASGASALAGMFMFVGPLLLLLTTIAEWIMGNFFSMMVCGLFSYSTTGSAAEGAVSKEYNAVIALYLIVWGFVLLMFFIFTLKTNMVFAGIFLFVTLGAWILSGAYWKVSTGDYDQAGKLQKTGGAMLFIVGLLGFYITFVIMAAEMRLAINLPVGDLSHYWKKTDVELAAAAKEA
ncbi:Protein alcS [Cyphellophora attinorum]|uniref:Protein alcS n=1 Tax=Cyphellophora attinorum TaxID=1664694 RepID=A0A0N1NWP9_9EURO|nr:Protein alcS [Phialophora attinorum]KPI35973.1 Protein alcS [Phialophora attinorum]